MSGGNRADGWHQLGFKLRSRPISRQQAAHIIYQVPAANLTRVHTHTHTQTHYTHTADCYSHSSPTVKEEEREGENHTNSSMSPITTIPNTSELNLDENLLRCFIVISSLDEDLCPKLLSEFHRFPLTHIQLADPNRLDFITVTSAADSCISSSGKFCLTMYQLISGHLLQPNMTGHECLFEYPLMIIN